MALLSLPARARPFAGYRAGAKDFAAFQDGIALALQVQPRLFPEGVGSVAGVLYDARDLYVYSRDKSLPFRKWRRWKEYVVYRLPLRAGVPPGLWGGCRGGGGSFVEREGLKGRLRASYFECAPLRAFVRTQQSMKGSIYTTRESYLGSIVHEFAHQYQARLSSFDRPAVIDELIPRVEAVVPGSSDLGASSIREAYAEWCELSASQGRLPEHFRKMLAEAPRRVDEPHAIGLRAVLGLWRAKHPGKAASAPPER